MNRKSFDKLVSFVGLGLAGVLIVLGGLLNYGATFANSSVKSQLENQNIAFPPEAGLPAETKEQLSKWAGMQVTTGQMARDYSDLFIWEHMKGASMAVMGKESTYSEVSAAYMGAMKSGTEDPAKVAQLAELRNTLFMGNTLRGMLLEAYAFDTLGVIAGYGSIACFVAGLIFLLLALAGFMHIRRTPDDERI